MRNLNPSNQRHGRTARSGRQVFFIARRNESVTLLAGALALALAAIHVFAGRVRSLSGLPRNYWLSMAGGASVAYVFVHILPELEDGETVLAGVELLARFFERHVYLVALVGFALFYGLERLAKESRSGAGALVVGEETKTTAAVFWIHLGSFAAYDALVGYLLVHREQPGVLSLVFFAAAMALHFVVVDFGLRDHHHDAYDHVGRWVLAAAILVGWAVGAATEVSEPVVDTLFAFLAGSVILNVIKEELPAERESRFWAFAVGAFGYAVILLFV